MTNQTYPTANGFDFRLLYRVVNKFFILYSFETSVENFQNAGLGR